ncbi:MAG TPA: inorganic pyrophosphatase [Candidatus Hydrogenedentes bacterium]|nr:inorganic pyrophosphatase [Candidatus Hydrogenedentota bacterium]HRK35139.1 inorganic pyrophosphatase [Candidatus Hydrogenedentota bacterium]
MTDNRDSLSTLMSLLYCGHPWHGVPIGERAPEIVTAYIEMSPTDTVKYELDKDTGLLKVDRPQKFSSTCPTLYGFVPQTYCAEKSGAYCSERTGRPNIVGDGDPLDICVLTEKPIRKSNVLLQAIPIGGLRMIDGNEADDKIIAVMMDDETFGDMRKISDCPKRLIDRLRHYFLTYKQAPDATDQACEITHVYDRDEAREVIVRGREDYLRRFANISNLLNKVVQGKA